ncbi:MAG: hypothetical protein EKK48_27400 [Candidatus Melainabacteria bacterium]|nr:MAG: hypothetical protein EKK48_27400 [Candidatus Melainabacteria bacterium]
MYNRADPSLFDVLAIDDSLPMDKEAARCWLVNLKHPLRLTVMHVCRLGATITLCTAYFLKRLFPIQFSAHHALQATICWFMKNVVTPEANYIILRHFWTESNIINFVIANSKNCKTPPADLYPCQIDDFMKQTFIDHDIVLFNSLHDLGSVAEEDWPVPLEKLDFSLMRDIDFPFDVNKRKFAQVVDFETAHELFKALFCVLLKASEYERSINSLQFDQSLAIRAARITGHAEIAALAGNTYPMFLVGPLHLSQRFVLHGLFTEHLHEYLLQLRDAQSKLKQKVPV